MVPGTRRNPPSRSVSASTDIASTEQQHAGTSTRPVLSKSFKSFHSARGSRSSAAVDNVEAGMPLGESVEEAPVATGPRQKFKPKESASFTSEAGLSTASSHKAFGEGSGSGKQKRRASLIGTFLSFKRTDDSPEPSQKQLQRLTSKRETGTDKLRRLGSALGLLNDFQLDEPRVPKSRRANLAVLRAAVTVMFPPQRRKMLLVMKDFIEPQEYAMMSK